MKYLFIYLAGISLILFFTMGLDKSRAKRHKWRVSERMLFILAAIGGAAGGCLGMLVFRHKTKHPAFQWGFPLLLAVQAAALWLIWKNGILT